MTDEARSEKAGVAADDMGVAADRVSAAFGTAQTALESQAEEEKEKQLEREYREVQIDLLLNKGLYHTIDTETEVGKLVLHDLRHGATLSFDCYCVGCRQESTFRIQSQNVATRSIGGRYADQVTPPALFAVRAVCQRNFHVYTYVFNLRKNTLTKIGQAPSLADISFGELRTIDKSLDDVDRRELGKALGLYAHDTALGAFVYLRRVFERMVLRAHQRQSAAGHAVERFDGMRMDKRIAALKDELPAKVVQNSAVFSVLSVGLHELTEEQCAKYFPVLKAVLFQMLEQEEHKRKAAITARETDLALEQILSDLGAGGERVART